MNRIFIVILAVLAPRPHLTAMEEKRNIVEKGFWPKMRPLIGKLPFAHDLLAAYYCAFDKETPFKVKAILFSALAYFVLPFDAIPDFIPVIGFSDDAAALVAAIAAVKSAITSDHLEAATRELQKGDNINDDHRT